MDMLGIVVCFVLGLVLGSFANIVIVRVPEGRSVVTPPSACPECSAPIAPRDNIPVLSWLALGGRCRRCGARIPARYPLVEVATGVAFAAVAARIGWDWALPAFLLYTWTLLVVAVIDARTRRIPNRLTYPLTPVLVALFVAAALLDGDPASAGRAVLGGVVAFAALFVLALISPRGMGMGDVKLGGFIGVGLGYLGWAHVLLGVFGAFVLGGAVAIALIVARLRNRKDLLPFGPYLAASAILAVLLGRPLLDGYRALAGI
jgi:leader peptidase (prepilin peptidase) / N-methyltransferase